MTALRVKKCKEQKLERGLNPESNVLVGRGIIKRKNEVVREIGGLEECSLVEVMQKRD